MIHSMLYATDLGLYAPLVMQHALALARTFNADLYVCLLYTSPSPRDS